MHPEKEMMVSGWGRHPIQKAFVVRPDKYRDLATAPGDALPRGLGRSYGDAALNQGGHILEMSRLNRILSFDDAQGLLVAEAGLSLASILDIFLPRGWFLPVTPGTKFVTLGGAIASDVHGKNHHGEGTFSNHVNWFDLITPEGSCLRCSRQENQDVFWAAVGGLGLLGTITTVSLRLKKVASNWMRLQHVPAADLEAVFSLLSDPQRDAPYTVAWIDCMARGRNLGRSIFMAGDHVGAEDLAPARPPRSEPRFSIPVDFPSWTLNAFTVRAFNETYYRLNKRKVEPFLSEIDPFFYPLDAVGHWNRCYGPRGFVQYQCVLPPRTAYEGMAKLLDQISGAGAASFLAVLKRLGPANQAPLAFPMEGYTLALDLPYRGEATPALLARLDALVMAAGGRVNLCKDSSLLPEYFFQMYDQFGIWRDAKRRVDPNWIRESSLSRRLGMKERE